MIRTSLIAATTLALTVATTTPSPADSGRAAGAPTIGQQGDVSYVSGGVGDEEQKRLEEMARDFNLEVTFAGRSGAYGGGSRVEIRDQAGKTLIDAESRGPLFYAKLPPGSYTVSASGAGAGGQKKTVQIAEHRRTAVLFTVQQAEGPRPADAPRAAGR